jgi:anti-sigma factor RsiW
MTNWGPDVLSGFGFETAEPVCAKEAAVVEAALTGRRTAEIEAHLATCAECRALQADVAAMTQLARRTEVLADRRRLPEPGQLWWRAQLARRWEAEERAIAPLDMMQRVEAIIGVGAVIVLLVVFVRSLGGGGLVPAPVLVWPALAELASGQQLPLVAGGLFLVVTTIIVLHRLLIED